MVSATGPDMVSVRQSRGGPQTEISDEIVEKGDIYFAFRPRIEEDNPEAGSPPGAGLPDRDEAHYPKPLEEKFRGRRFASEDPQLLDYEGAEFILVGARTDPERAYAVDIETEDETARTADIFRQLK